MVPSNIMFYGKKIFIMNRQYNDFLSYFLGNRVRSGGSPQRTGLSIFKFS